MSLQYVEPTLSSFPIGIFARSGGGGNQKPGSGQGAGKPSFKKASKKTATKAAKKKKK
jgi:hypothetical protein